MAYRVRLLARPEVALGFALAGMRPTEIASPEAGAARLRELLGAPDVGVVLLEEALYDHLGEDVRRQIARRPLPMVVPFPGPAWQEDSDKAQAYIVELLRQVIGYRVRIA
jgi:vacuolar-type H+-ATPase subunit F/Vma7